MSDSQKISFLKNTEFELEIKYNGGLIEQVAVFNAHDSLVTETYDFTILHHNTFRNKMIRVSGILHHSYGSTKAELELRPSDDNDHKIESVRLPAHKYDSRGNFDNFELIPPPLELETDSSPQFSFRDSSLTVDNVSSGYATDFTLEATPQNITFQGDDNENMLTLSPIDGDIPYIADFNLKKSRVTVDFSLTFGEDFKIRDIDRKKLELLRDYDKDTRKGKPFKKVQRFMKGGCYQGNSCAPCNNKMIIEDLSDLTENPYHFKIRRDDCASHKKD